jgi:hypothetical protein
MITINCLLTVPVIWTLIREVSAPGPVRMGRIVATAALMAVPLLGALAITITGLAVVYDE